MKTDVLVVGGGVAGAMAALAARELGREVWMAARAPGATALSSGGFEVAPDPGAGPGSPFGRGRTVTECIEAIAGARPSHPYARVGAAGRARMGDAFRLLAEHLRRADLSLSAYEGSRPNHYLPGPMGRLRAVAVAEASQAKLDLTSKKTRVAVLELTRVAAADGALVAASLAALPGLADRVRLVRADWPSGDDAPFLLPADLGRLLDEPGQRAALVAAIQPALGKPRPTHLLIPAIAGTHQASRVASELGRALSIEVVEALGGEASLPGLRLHRALGQALESAGVHVDRIRVQPDGGELTLARGNAGEGIAASATVLATGRFIGGGLARRGTLRETVLGAPVVAGGRPLQADVVTHLTRADPFEPQPVFEAGIAVDAALRPADLDGRPIEDNVLAAGSVIGGYDPVRDGTGLGVAVLTGYLAGRRAAGEGAW